MHYGPHRGSHEIFLPVETFIVKLISSPRSSPLDGVQKYVNKTSGACFNVLMQRTSDEAGAVVLWFDLRIRSY